MGLCGSGGSCRGFRKEANQIARAIACHYTVTTSGRAIGASSYCHPGRRQATVGAPMFAFPPSSPEVSLATSGHSRLYPHKACNLLVPLQSPGNPRPQKCIFKSEKCQFGPPGKMAPKSQLRCSKTPFLGIKMSKSGFFGHLN